MMPSKAQLTACAVCVLALWLIPVMLFGYCYWVGAVYRWYWP